MTRPKIVTYVGCLAAIMAIPLFLAELLTGDKTERKR